MKKKKIYVLHEYGAPSHYYALQDLARNNDYELLFYELWTWKSVIKHPERWRRYIVNKLFWTIIPFLKRSKFVVGIAPCNNRVESIMKKLRKHEVYYHTSYTRWDGSTFVHRPKSDEIISKWRFFTNSYVKHIFAVSNKTKEELISNNFASTENVSVVYHSFNIEINTPEYKKKENTFIYVGRLSEKKGVLEILSFFSSHSELQLTIVGDGNLRQVVQEYAIKYQNINYLGYINGLNALVPIYQRHCFSLLNSKKIGAWEELFGITIIESMACGCVPICTKHPGPMEIITDNENGYIVLEDMFLSKVEWVSDLNEEEYLRMRSNAIKKSKEYQADQIARRWEKIF